MIFLLLIVPSYNNLDKILYFIKDKAHFESYGIYKITWTCGEYYTGQRLNENIFASTLQQIGKSYRYRKFYRNTKTLINIMEIVNYLENNAVILFYHSCPWRDSLLTRLPSPALKLLSNR